MELEKVSYGGIWLRWDALRRNREMELFELSYRPDYIAGPAAHATIVYDAFAIHAS